MADLMLEAKQAMNIKSNLMKQFDGYANQDAIRRQVSKSSVWLINKIKQAAKEGGNQYEKTIPKLGHLYLWVYDPKTKDTLPYWDMYPLDFVFRKVKGGFYGINLHYLPPPMRMKIFKTLLDFKIGKTDENTRLRFTWDMIKGLQGGIFKHCIKRYLTSHMRTKFIEIPPDEWEFAVRLPLANFKGQFKNRVWQDARGYRNK